MANENKIDQELLVSLAEYVLNGGEMPTIPIVPQGMHLPLMIAVIQVDVNQGLNLSATPDNVPLTDKADYYQSLLVQSRRLNRRAKLLGEIVSQTSYLRF